MKALKKNIKDHELVQMVERYKVELLENKLKSMQCNMLVQLPPKMKLIKNQVQRPTWFLCEAHPFYKVICPTYNHVTAHTVSM